MANESNKNSNQNEIYLKKSKQSETLSNNRIECIGMIGVYPR